MRNNIAFFLEKVKPMDKINAEFIFALNFAQNLTSLLLVFSKEAILFLIYLLADKANYGKKRVGIFRLALFLCSFHEP